MKNSWKDQIEIIFGKLMVLKRGDLVTDSDWLIFTKQLATGIKYEYAFRSNMLVFTDSNESSVLKPLAGLSDPKNKIGALIDGVKPRPGTQGYFVYARIESSNFAFKASEIFWYNQSNVHNYRDIILSYLAELLIDQIHGIRAVFNINIDDTNIHIADGLTQTIINAIKLKLNEQLGTIGILPKYSEGDIEYTNDRNDDTALFQFYITQASI